MASTIISNLVSGGIVPGSVACITGAGYGGIGFAVASSLLLKYKLKVVLLDNDVKSLKESSQALTQLGLTSNEFESIQCDVSSFEQVSTLANSIREKYGRIDFLMLNAGVQIKTENFKEGGDLVNWNKILNVNLFGVINGVQAFVDAMVNQATPATIVITGSKQGITNPPGNPAYNVSKAAVRSLSDNLSYSLLNTKVQCHLLVPGYVFTKLTNSSGATVKPESAWEPRQIADYLFEEIEKGSYYIICPDNDVNWELDSARMEWSANDILKGRKALSRWNPEYKEEFEAFIASRVSKS